MQDKIMRFEKMLDRELEADLEQIEKTGTLSPDNIKMLKDTFKLKKLVKECCDGDDGYSTRRGRSMTTGRYMSRGYDESGSESYGYEGASNRGSYRGGYSGHDKMIDHLERMYDEAEDAKERQMIKEWIHKAEQSR